MANFEDFTTFADVDNADGIVTSEIQFDVVSMPTTTYIYNTPDALEDDPDLIRSERMFFSTPLIDAYSGDVYNALKNVEFQCAADYQRLCSTNDEEMMIANLDDILSQLFGVDTVEISSGRRLTISQALEQSSGRKLISTLRSLYKDSPFKGSNSPLTSLVYRAPGNSMASLRSGDAERTKSISNTRFRSTVNADSLTPHTNAANARPISNRKLLNKAFISETMTNESPRTPEGPGRGRPEHPRGPPPPKDPNRPQPDPAKPVDPPRDPDRNRPSPGPPKQPPSKRPPTDDGPADSPLRQPPSRRPPTDDGPVNSHPTPPPPSHGWSGGDSDSDSDFDSDDDDDRHHMRMREPRQRDPHPRPPSPHQMVDDSFSGALGFGADGDICLYKNVYELSSPCLTAVADVYQLREQYWQESQPPPPPHHHGWAFFFICGAALVLFLRGRRHAKKRMEVRTFMDKIRSNPTLKAQVESETGMNVPDIPTCCDRHQAGQGPTGCIFVRALKLFAFFVFVTFSSFLIAVTSLEIVGAMIGAMETPDSDGTVNEVSMPMALLLLVSVCTIQVAAFALAIKGCKLLYLRYRGSRAVTAVSVVPSSESPKSDAPSNGGTTVFINAAPATRTLARNGIFSNVRGWFSVPGMRRAVPQDGYVALDSDMSDDIPMESVSRHGGTEMVTVFNRWQPSSEASAPVMVNVQQPQQQQYAVYTGVPVARPATYTATPVNAVNFV